MCNTANARSNSSRLQLISIWKWISGSTMNSNPSLAHRSCLLLYLLVNFYFCNWSNRSCNFPGSLSPKNSNFIPCLLYLFRAVCSQIFEIWNRPQDKRFYCYYFIIMYLSCLSEKAFLINIRIHKTKIFAYLKPFLLLLLEKKEIERKKERHILIVFDHRSTRKYICTVFTFHRNLLCLFSSFSIYKERG